MKSAFKGIVVLTLVTVVLIAGAARASEVSFTPVAPDFRSLLEDKLHAAILADDSDAALKWAQALEVTERTKVTKEIGDAVAPVIKGYASVTKEFGPQLEAIGPVLKEGIKSYLGYQMKFGLVEEKAKPTVKGIVKALEAKTAGEVVTHTTLVVDNITKSMSESDKASKDYWDTQMRETTKLGK